MTRKPTVPVSGDAAAAVAEDASSMPSAGRPESHWINPPLARIPWTAGPTHPIATRGVYAAIEPSGEIDVVHSEIGEWRLAAAASFWAFEDSLPEE